MKRTTVRTGIEVLACLAFGLSLGAAAAFGREKYEEKFSRSEALAKDGKVYLVNFSGDIDIQSWKEAQVKIEALKVSEAASLEKAKENAALVPIEVTSEPGIVRIETKYPKNRKEWGGDSLSVSVTYKLWIPEKASFEVKSVSGDVKVAPVGGQARVKSVSGNVSVLGAAGADISLVSGDMTVENLLGDAYLKVVSGTVRAAKIKGSVETESVSGDLLLKDVAEARSVTAKSVSGNITYAGDILAGGNYEFSAHSGNVELRLPAKAAFDLEANTFSGVIDSDFPIQVVGKISPKEIRGTVNGGGARIRAKAFSGNVEIKKY